MEWLAYMKMVDRILQKMYHRIPDGVHKEDLRSAGLEGLVLAAKKYKPTFNVPFSKYAAMVVRWAIADELRVLDRLPRRQRDKLKKWYSKRKILTNKLGRGPTLQEIEEYLGSQPVLEVLFVPTEPDNLGDPSLDLHENLVQKEKIRKLINILKSLPERTFQIIKWRYCSECSLMEIATKLGLSESRIWQIEKETINKIKEKMKDYH